MKKFIISCLTLTFSFLQAQEIEETIEVVEPQVQISVYGKSIKASVITNNDTNTITLLNKKQEGKIVIVDYQAKTDTSNYRKFMITTAKDETLKVPFTSRLVGIINANLKDILSQTEVGKTYYLYTISTPKDPQLAARVRVRRILLSKIVIK